MQPSRMPVLVSGASFACNFVRGSYLEVRVTTSATGNRAMATAVPASLFLSCKRRQGSFNGFGLNHADQRGGSRRERKRRFSSFRVGEHPIFDRVKNDFISGEWTG